MELSCSSRKIILKGKGSKPGETTRIPAIYFHKSCKSDYFRPEFGGRNCLPLRAFV